MAGRSTLYAVETRCSAEEPRGRSFDLAPGRTRESYGVFPAPKEGTTFAVQWYDFPRAGGLKLQSEGPGRADLTIGDRFPLIAPAPLVMIGV